MSNKDLREIIAVRNIEILCYERLYQKARKSRQHSMEMLLYGMEPNNKEPNNNNNWRPIAITEETCICFHTRDWTFEKEKIKSETCRLVWFWQNKGYKQKAENEIQIMED